ncbi:PKD domain-containing protein, partial [Foetidibacter luteolus]|uniref:PKD domain-containing protein n=1 Tax=Foetidibacter luteolus TaxID=2608880 RepID=UPI001A98A756
TASAKTSFVVNKAPNVAPVASVKAPASITLPVDSLVLDGAASYDKDGSIKQYKWELTTAPVGYSFSAANTATVKLSSLVVGSYTATLTITDNDGATASAKTSFVVNKAPNVAPVASVKAPASITLPVDSLTLDGSASYDKDGSIKQYKWQLTAAPVGYSSAAANAATIKLTKLAAGSYTATLTVIDNDGATASAKVSFLVNKAPNVAPVASVKAPASITLPVDSLILDGAASYDKDGSIKQYKWELTTAPAGYTFTATNSATVKLSKLVAGSYAATLTITDNAGATASAGVSFTVNEQRINTAPVAITKAPTAITLPEDSVLVDGSGSYDKDGRIAQYKWQMISGPASYILNNTTGAKLVLNKLVAGTYSIQLTVKDNDGAQDVSIVNLVVNPKPVVVEEPVTETIEAIVKGVQDITLPVNSITFDGSSSKVPGGKIKYAWKFVSGPGGYYYTHPFSPTFKIYNLSPGTRTWQLTVTDGKGNSATKQFTFTVFKQSNNRTAVNSSAATAEMALPQPAKTALNIKPGLTMAPVPAVSNMNIYLNDEATGKVTIRISDASGRVIMLKNNLDKNEATWQYNLQVSQLISGMYYCEVIIGNKKLNGKFVKVN